MKLQKIFKSLFFVGCGLCFFSLFMNLYSFEVYNEVGDLIASWNYTMLRGWSGINSAYRPPDLLISIEFMFIYIGTIISAIIFTLIKNIERAENLGKYLPYLYMNIFLLIIVGFLIVIFPIFFLLRNNLYFPMLIVYDESVKTYFHYSVGISYYLQSIGFVLIFPFIIFQYKIIRKFNIDSNDKTRKISHLLEKENEKLDLDRYIAEEKLKDEYNLIKKQKDREYEFKSQILQEGGF